MLFLTLFAIFCKVILAQNYITNPVQGTVFNAGEVETILWNRLNEVDVKSVRIDLVDGDSNNARFVMLIAELSPTVISYDWKVPSDLVSKSDYFLRMSSRGKNGQVVYNYSARFSIVGGSGTYKVPKKTDDNTSDGNSNDLDMMVIFSMIFLWIN